MPKSNQYLERQFNNYNVTLKIPKDVQDFFGRTKFYQTLETSSLQEANLRKWKYIEKWKDQIRIVRQAKRDQGILGKDGLVQKLQIEVETKWQGFEEDAYLLLAEGMENSKATPQEKLAADEVLMRVKGEWSSTKEYMEGFLAQHSYSEQTRDEASAALKHFTNRFGVFENITEYDMTLYVDGLLNGEGDAKPVSRRTVKKKIGFIRQYWSYCVKYKHTAAKHTGVLTENIYPSDTKTKASTQKAMLSTRLAFTVQDYHKLLSAKPDDEQLCDLIKLAAYTGARREELCSMRLEQVLDDRLVVEDAKTNSGWREIPIHSDIKQLVERLVQTSDDGYLFSGLTSNKYGKRGAAIGKRFLRLRDRLGYTGRHVLHSFRKTLITQMKNNGVPVSHCALIVGHDVDDITYGLYGEDIDWEKKVQAMEGCSYNLNT